MRYTLIDTARRVAPHGQSAQLASLTYAVYVVVVLACLPSMLHADEPAGAAPPTTAEFFPALSAREQEIAAALDSQTNFDFTEQPLQNVVDYLKNLHHIEIQLDSKALADAGIGTDTPVTRSLKGVSLKSALGLVLDDLDLTCITKNEVLLITSKDRASNALVTRTYPVGDLAREQEYCELTDAILSTVLPSTWHRVGGPATLASVKSDKCLAISHTQAAHEEILDLLRSLRAARKVADASASK